MGQSEQTRAADYLTPMMQGTDGNSAGAVIAVTTSAAAVDISTIPAVPNTLTRQANASPIGHYFAVQNQGGGSSAFVIFGQNFADVTGSNAPNPANTSTVNASTGVVTVRGTLCVEIPAGNTAYFKLGVMSDQPTASAMRFMAYVTASGAATLRCWQSDLVF